MKLGIIGSEDLQVIFWQAFDLIKKIWAAVKANPKLGVKLPGEPI